RSSWPTSNARAAFPLGGTYSLSQIDHAREARAYSDDFRDTSIRQTALRERRNAVSVPSDMCRRSRYGYPRRFSSSSGVCHNRSRAAGAVYFFIIVRSLRRRGGVLADCHRPARTLGAQLLLFAGDCAPSQRRLRAERIPLIVRSHG